MIYLMPYMSRVVKYARNIIAFAFWQAALTLVAALRDVFMPIALIINDDIGMATFRYHSNASIKQSFAYTSPEHIFRLMYFISCITGAQLRQ